MHKKIMKIKPKVGEIWEGRIPGFPRTYGRCLILVAGINAIGILGHILDTSSTRFVKGTTTAWRFCWYIWPIRRIEKR